MRRPRPVTAALLVAVLTTPVRANEPGAVELPFERPARPFLLVDAERRFLPTEPATLRVQLRSGAPVRVAVFRLDDPSAWTRRAVEPDGLAVATGPVGLASEALLRAHDPLPRRGGGLTLVRDELVTLAAPTPARRTGGDESAAYDSSEEDEGTVETRWVHAGAWRDQRVSLGTLSPGVYLARVFAGAYAASALVSVGDLTLLARRGDRRDVVAVATADGSPRAGVEVAAFAGDAASRIARTDERGEARLDASDDAAVRFVAHDGEQWAWADVAHARLAPCDTRVYLDPGRPLFRRGEVMHLRGHARGCVDGRDRPLARVAVTVQGGADATASTTVRTDADGNFVTELTAASGELRALIDGRPHVRAVVIDDRQLPTQALVVSADRSFAAEGDVVRLRASDDAGRWASEASVVFEFMGRRELARVGPDHAAEVAFTVGRVGDAARREVARATLAHDGRTTTAQTELWVGARRELLHLEAGAAPGAPGGTATLTLRAEDLGGARLREAVALRVSGSDGNRAVGPVRWTGRAETSAAGDASVEVRLPGAGPWWVTASLAGGEAAEAGTVVWDRARPPSLGSRGALSVRPGATAVVAGSSLPIDLMRPARGATWVTLEQSGVWASAWVPAGAPAAGAAWWRTVLSLPPEAQGVASVVATHLAGGSVTSATAVVGVTAAPALSLRVTSDLRAYPEGATMHATVVARGPDGAPRDAVVSLWLADEGYWELGDETYPSVDAMLALPGRPASGGDSTRPRAWGADEGRPLDPEARWNDAPLPHLTRYDAWNAAGSLVTFTSRGMFGAVATALARSAGLTRAEVCAERERALGAVSLSSRDVPWDLLAARVAERTDTRAWVDGATLHLGCEAGSYGTGRGFGAGSGSGHGGMGLGGRNVREQRLEGDLFFIGARALGPDGRLDVDVPLPSHPGRWRLQALAIDGHARGDRAHAVVTTSRALTASVDAPATLRPGDRARAALSVHAPSLAGRRAAVTITGDGVSVEGAPAALVLDARGDGRAGFFVAATRAGRGSVVGRARVDALEDAVRAGVTVQDDEAVAPLSVHAVVDAQASDVDVVVPALAREAEVVVDADPSLVPLFDEVLASLSGPRWSAPSILVERLAAVRTLASVVNELPPSARGERRERIYPAVGSMVSQLSLLRGLDGALGWWRTLGSDAFVTATLLVALQPDANGPRWDDAREFVRARAVTAQGDEAARIAEALAVGRVRADAVLARAVLARLAATASLSLDATRAAYASALRVDPAAAPRWADRLRARLATALTQAPAPCRGVAWFLCFAAEGDRAAVARAALALPIDGADTASLRERALRYLAAHPADAGAWRWGTAEADVLALLARSVHDGAGSSFTVSLDGREVARGDGAHPARVRVAQAGTLRVSFAASPGRVTRVHVRGDLALAPVASTVGPAALERRVVADAAGSSLALRWTLPRAVTGVEVVVPLPAGVELASPAGGRARVRATDEEIGWWPSLDRAPRSLRPLITRRGGALVLRMKRLGAGAHALTLPLVTTAAGRFTAGGATLRTDDPTVWSVTPPFTIDDDAAR